MRPLRISPSQMKRWASCPRLTAYQVCTSIRPAKDPLPRANDLGTRCHEIAEAWLRDGTYPDLTETFTYYRPSGDPETVYPGAIVTAGMHLLPAPREPGLTLEAALEFSSPTSIYASRADMRRPGWIGDHKFVRDFGSALSSEPGKVNAYGDPNYLADDPQFVIQIAHEFVQNRVLKEASGSWIYYETKISGGKHHAKRVHLTILRDEAESRFEELEKTSALIQGVYKNQIQPKDLPPVSKSCKAYGRPCDFVDACNLSEGDILRGMMGDRKMVDEQIAELLKNLKQGAISPTPGDAPPPPPPPPPLAAPAPPAAPRAAATVTDAGRAAMQAAIDKMYAKKHAKAPDPVNPPEAPEETGAPGPLAAVPASQEVTVPEGGYEAMDRPALKALAVQRGLCTSGSRLGAPALITLLRGAAVAGAVAKAVDETDHSDIGSAVGVESEVIRDALDAINSARRALDMAEGALDMAEGALRAALGIEDRPTVRPASVERIERVA